MILVPTLPEYVKSTLLVPVIVRLVISEQFQTVVLSPVIWIYPPTPKVIFLVLLRTFEIKLPVLKINVLRFSWPKESVNNLVDPRVRLAPRASIAVDDPDAVTGKSKVLPAGLIVAVPVVWANVKVFAPAPTVIPDDIVRDPYKLNAVLFQVPLNPVKFKEPILELVVKVIESVPAVIAIGGYVVTVPADELAKDIVLVPTEPL